MRMHFPTQLQMLYFSQMAIRIEYSPKLLQHTKLKLKCHQFHRMHRNCLAFEVQYLKFCTEMYIISLHRIRFQCLDEVENYANDPKCKMIAFAREWYRVKKKYLSCPTKNNERVEQLCDVCVCFDL